MYPESLSQVARDEARARTVAIAPTTNVWYIAARCHSLFAVLCCSLPPRCCSPPLAAATRCRRLLPLPRLAQAVLLKSFVLHERRFVLRLCSLCSAARCHLAAAHCHLAANTRCRRLLPLLAAAKILRASRVKVRAEALTRHL